MNQQYYEHMEHEFNSQFDDIRERYHREAEDMRNESLMSDEYAEYMDVVYKAGFGEDAEAYEAYWKRIEQYAKEMGL